MSGRISNGTDQEECIMKVFVSTRTTQGDVPGDFCFVPANELVGRYSPVCDDEKPDGSGVCGCGQAFAGFTTHSGTTTAVVAERDMTELDWRAELFQTLSDTGWAKGMSADELGELVDDLVEHDLRSAAELPVGLIVGRRASNDRNGTTDRLMFRGVAAANDVSRV